MGEEKASRQLPDSDRGRCFLSIKELISREMIEMEK